MNSIKTMLMLATLSAGPALLAAEPVEMPATAPAPSAVSTNAPAFSEDLADQAALVQQIGEAAARGFDPEAHARSLRLQIEALAHAPVKDHEKAPTVTPPTVSSKPSAPALSPPASVAAPATPSAPAPATGRDPAVRDSLQKLKSALNELETRLSGSRKDQ